MHMINFKTYSRRDTLLISIILQTTQTNLLVAYVHNNAFKCSRKVEYAMHIEVDVDTQRNIIIPFQFKEQFFGEFESEPAKLGANLYFIATHIYCDTFQVLPYHTSNKLHLQSY